MSAGRSGPTVKPPPDDPDKVNQQEIDRVGRNTKKAVTGDQKARYGCENHAGETENKRNNKAQVQTRRCSPAGYAVKNSTRSKKQYPATPQTATGRFPRIEYGDWETVSQLKDFDRAQKL